MFWYPRKNGEFLLLCTRLGYICCISFINCISFIYCDYCIYCYLLCLLYLLCLFFAFIVFMAITWKAGILGWLHWDKTHQRNQKCQVWDFYRENSVSWGNQEFWGDFWEGGGAKEQEPEGTVPVSRGSVPDSSESLSQCHSVQGSVSLTGDRV